MKSESVEEESTAVRTGVWVFLRKCRRMAGACLKNIVYAGFVNEGSADVRKQIIISSTFTIFSFILLVFFGVEGLEKGNKPLAAVVLATAGASIINYVFLRRTGSYRLSSIAIVVMMTLLSLYLLCTGGDSNTGPLWMFVLPGLIYYILGLVAGSLYVAALLGLIAFILFTPDNGLLQAQYGTAFTIRFIVSLWAAAFVAFVYEYSREDGRRELLNLSRRLDYLSRRDELTGLSNRRDMFERLRDEVNRVERSGRSFVVLLADIDHFKMINDTYGHECGDQWLQQVAATLSRNTQKRDAVARWGGEEFLVLLPETGAGQARGIAERLRLAVAQQQLPHGAESLSLTISIGVAEYVRGQSLSELIKMADGRLYQAKGMGRNRVEG